MATLQPRWVIGVLRDAWGEARSQLQQWLADLERKHRLFQDDTERRLRALEAGGVAARATASANLTVNSTVAANLVGAAVSFSPTQAVTALVVGSFDCACTAFPSGVASKCVIELQVNGVADPAQIVYTPTAVNGESTVAQAWVIPMAAGLTYALQATGKLSAAGNTYAVAKTNSGLGVILAG